MDQSKSSYPGTRDLPVEVKDRVLATYRQSLELHQNGRNEEARAGCELILTMDGSFAPARRLLDSIQKAASGVAPGSPAPDSAATTLVAAKRALESRDFQRAIELSNAVLRADLMNQQAQDIGRQAQERLEANPFVDQFVKKAEGHLASGKVSAARAELEKARSLDPTHPALLQLAKDMPPDAPAQPEPARPTDTFELSGDSPFQFDFAAGSDTTDTDTEFVLDEPAPSPDARSAQASDFGFSFEEDSPSAGEPSVNPVSPVQPGEAQTFDFSSTSRELSEEEQQRIDGLLKEGDAAFENVDYRQATDVWSKIFLIDVTNAAASERIEKARQLQQELDSRVDEILTSSILAFEAGEFPAARSGFEQALRLDPTQPRALEYLHKIPSDAPEPDLANIDFDPPPPMTEPEDDLYAAYGIQQATLEDSTFAPATPPDAAAAARTPPSTSAMKPAKRRGSWLIILAVALVLGVAGWFAWTYFAAQPEATADDQTALILSRAQALGKSERYDQAIDLLSSIGADDPMHDRAVALIAQYKTRKSAGAAPVDGRPATVVFAELVEQGRASFIAHDYVAAKESLTRAAAIQPLSPEATAILQNSTVQVAKLDSALVLFKEGKYTEAVVQLEDLLEQDPENRNIQQLLANAHFNLGATALREDRLDDAIREFESVLAWNPDDDLARRSREIALRYREAPKDLLFRIYVKYLPLR